MKKLEPVSTDQRGGFGEEIDRLRKLAENALSGERGVIRPLRLKLNRLARKAEALGTSPIDHLARRAEQEIERDLMKELRRLSERSRGALNALFAEFPEVKSLIEGQIERTPDHQPPEPTAEPERVIIVVGDVPDLPPDLTEQMAVYRFAVVHIKDIEALQAFCHASIGAFDTGFQSGLIVSTVQFFSGYPERLRVLQHVRNIHKSALAFLAVGENDDFPARLRAVRYGAAAFLSLPLDFGAFIDWAETLLSQEQKEPIHVLIIDDDPEQVSDAALTLQEAGMITSVATDPRNIFKVLVEYRPELILMDMYMEACTGPELTRMIRQNENFVSVPIIYLSVEREPQKQIAAVMAGGDGFLEKPFDRQRLITMVQNLANRTRSMRFYMERDSLTGLLNHTNLKQQLENEVRRAERMGISVSFAMIDIDRFKSVNDTYGHLTGDRVIKSLARILQDRLRRSDIIGRYGGEEFGIILFNTDEEQAFRILDEIREAFSRINQSDGSREFHTTFSCGIAEFPRFSSPLQMSEVADAALYAAKEGGRNQVVIAPAGGEPRGAGEQ